MDITAIDPIVLAVIVGIVVIVAIVVVIMARRRRRNRFQERFGAEYGRAVEQAGSRRAADRRLADREKRRERYEVQPLPPGERETLRGRFEHVQAGFVTDPESAVERAEDLIQAAAKAKGYPADDREQLLWDLSIDHPREVDVYRDGLARRRGAGRHRPSTEDLRTSLLASRELFDVVVGAGRDDDESGQSTAFFRELEEGDASPPPPEVATPEANRRADPGAEDDSSREQRH